MGNITKTIAEKQRQYCLLQEELKEMIIAAQGMDASYKGRNCSIISIYTDGSADVALYDEEGNWWEENIKLIDLD